MRYNNISFQSKLITNCIILIIIPLIVYYLIFNIYITNTRNKEMQLIRQLNSQAVDSIDLYVDDIINISKQPLYNRNIISNLVKIDIDYDAFMEQRKHNFYEVGDTDNNKGRIISDEDDIELTNLVNTMRVYKKYIHSVFLFNKNGDSLYYSLCNGQLAQPYNPIGEEWFKRCTQLNGTQTVSGTTKIPNILPKAPISDSFVFSVSRVIKDVDRPGILGYISIFTNIEVLREACAKIVSVSGEEIYVLDSNNTIIFNADESSISKNINDLIFGTGLSKDIDLNAGSSVFSFDGKRYLVMVDKISSPDWKLVRIMPEDSLYLNVKEVQSSLILIIIAFTILSLLMSTAIAYGITKPLKKMITTMKVIENGDLSVRFKVKFNDEIGKLGRGFNSMIAKIESLINDVYITQMRKKEAELNALQAQINPHFIYNTLESIRMMARVNKDIDTANMISVLGSLLRYSISTKNQTSTLKDEIEHLNNYLTLQNHRFENKFTLIINIPEELSNMEIIKLIFQPIVENAIYHALETVESRGIITITAALTEEKVIFDIEDNGVGMSEQQLEDLVQHVNDFKIEQSNTRGIGLRNVNERIKLYYGQAYGLKISSEAGKGTVVRLEFPGMNIMNSFEYKN